MRGATSHTHGAQACSATDFLEEYIEGNPDRIVPTHSNMMAQLYMESGRHGDALALLERTMSLEACRAYPDLCAKVAACKAQLGDVQGALAFASAFYHPPGEESAFSAPEISDLYLEARPPCMRAAARGYRRRRRSEAPAVLV
jgi:hypothetical protein